jgi:hypothetical protein
LGEVDVACGRVKTATLGDGDKGAQVAEIQIHVGHALIEKNFAIHMLTPLMHDSAE